MQKIVITGPESIGKSTLVKQLGLHFCVNPVHEYAREYLENMVLPYNFSDVEAIAIGQIKKERETAESKPKFLLCDTDLLTIKIWMNDKFGKCSPWVHEHLDENPADLYLLCNTDTPWIPDPQREDPERRDELLAIYKKELIKMNIPFQIVSGTGDVRLSRAIKIIEKYLPN